MAFRARNLADSRLRLVTNLAVCLSRRTEPGAPTEFYDPPEHAEQAAKIAGLFGEVARLYRVASDQIPEQRAKLLKYAKDADEKRRTYEETAAGWRAVGDE